MFPIRPWGVLTIALFVTSLVTPVLAQEPQLRPDHAEAMKAGIKLFKEQVRGILEESCLECHNSRNAKADFDLSTRDRLVESGHLGTDPADSYLMQLVRHEETPGMPFKADKLTDAQITALAKWIELGAPYDAPFAPSTTTSTSPEITDSERRFWSFQRLQHSPPPTPEDMEWCRTEIDQFIRARQESANLVPNHAASRRTLIRRVYYDMLGVPPTPSEVQEFLAHDSDHAYTNMLDSVLDSPRYGERWARHWLDVARFAESTGFEHDDDIATAYHYRDFVIRAFNDDMPFDQFVRWQIAGDELAPGNPMAMMATAFLGAGATPTQITESEFESTRYDQLDDMVNTTGLAFLGLSLGCARCHDHKFDPIPASNYYSLAATFSKTVRSEVELKVDPDTDPQKVFVTGDGLPPLRIYAHDRGFPYFYEQVHFLRRGDVDQKEEVVKPGLLRVLTPDTHTIASWRSSGDSAGSPNRATLAAWLTDTEYGAGHLAARVIVNRLWHHHFGRGIVTTPNDFGMQGERPSHPELLDWLASELISQGWRLKPIHKLILNSSVYRQAVDSDLARTKIDPDNILIWRRIPRRLEAEAIRDGMLAVSGQLDLRMYGPGTLDESMRRRSIYFTIKRSKLIPSMMLFDWPEHLVSHGQRPSTTTAPQALLLLNNANTRSMAESFGSLLTDKTTQTPPDSRPDFHEAIITAYELAFSRKPTEQEIQLANRFLGQEHYQRQIQQPLNDFAQMLLSANEFIFIE